jgi:hypothetical protein
MSFNTHHADQAIWRRLHLVVNQSVVFAILHDWVAWPVVLRVAHVATGTNFARFGVMAGCSSCHVTNLCSCPSNSGVVFHGRTVKISRDVKAIWDVVICSGTHLLYYLVGSFVWLTQVTWIPNGYFPLFPLSISAGYIFLFLCRIFSLVLIKQY